MAREVRVPEISEDAESATVEEILVSEGDTIEKDQSIIALETDKASVEVPSSDAGKIKEIKVKEGDEVKAGDVVLILEDEEGGEDESGEEKEEEQAKKEEKEKEEEKKEKADKAEKKEKENKGKDEKGEKEKKNKAEKEEQEEKDKKDEKEKETENTEEKPKSEGKEAPASPAVRRLARELGVDIEEVDGTGPGDRISEDDVKSHAKEGTGKKQAARALKFPDFSKWGEVERKPLSGIRKATAKNVTTSWQAIPHVFQFDQADIFGIEEYMEKNSDKVEKAGGKLTITAILLKIVASALQQFPKFNGSVDMENEEMILKKYIHISIAVDTEKGLLMPVIRDVNKKSIVELSVELTEIAEKAREQELSLDEMQGGNFSISNLGGIGGANFTPIIYHPQVAILGVSRAETKPVYIDGKFEPRKILPLSLSYDHRMIDGAEGAEFLRWICQALEDPYKALLGA